MEKLTKKQYIGKLENTDFIACVWDKSIDEITKNLKRLKKSDYIYTVKQVQLRSKDIKIFRKDNDICSYRDFYGANKYYIADNFLFHINIANDISCIFINRINN